MLDQFTDEPHYFLLHAQLNVHVSNADMHVTSPILHSLMVANVNTCMMTTSTKSAAMGKSISEGYSKKKCRRL